MVLQVDKNVAVTLALGYETHSLSKRINFYIYYFGMRNTVANSQAFDVVRKTICMFILEVNWQLQC